MDNNGKNGRVDMANEPGRCLYCHGLRIKDGRTCPACNGTGDQTDSKRDWVKRAGLPAKERDNADSSQMAQ